MGAGAVDLAAVRWILVACIAGIVLLSIVRRHSAGWARERARRTLGQTDRRR